MTADRGFVNKWKYAIGIGCGIVLAAGLLETVRRPGGGLAAQGIVEIEPESALGGGLSRAAGTIGDRGPARGAPAAARLDAPAMADVRGEAACQGFVQWAARPAPALPAQRAGWEADGIQLAQQRRDHLEDLIQADPKRALELALPYRVRSRLPAAVLEWVEESVSGVGDLDVLAAIPAADGTGSFRPLFRTATVHGRTYQACVYGRRLGEPTRHEVALRGIAIGRWMAVAEDAVRVLEEEEASARLGAEASPACAVCGRGLAEPGAFVGFEVAGSVGWVCGPEHLEEVSQRWGDVEGEDQALESVPTIAAASVSSTGQKRLILIRVDFSDLVGVPFSDAAGRTLIEGLDAFYRENSYGKSSFAPEGAGSDITPTFRMPQTAAYYGGGDEYAELRSDARAAARAAGYVLSNYDLDMICFGSVAGWGWAGLAYVGAPGAWLRNSFGVGVAAHELGHNFGLSHANFWDTSGESVIGPGVSEEYGDKFDTMGSASAGVKHFNARYKSYLNWLEPSAIQTVTTSGVYEIAPHDLTEAAGIRGLRVAKNASTNYWIEFRQKYTSNRWLMSGAGLRWGRSGNQSTLLLDTTPGSADGKDDSAIVIGRTFDDPAAGVHITPLGFTGSSPETLRVMVMRGQFPANHPPALQLAAARTNTLTGQPLSFSAAASDEDGHELAYAWDFGDRQFGPNEPAVTHAWSSSGYYLVRCTVSDMRGGAATDSAVVRVGAPSGWVLSGQVTADGKPLPGVEVSASSSLRSWTDHDGSFWLPGVSSGNYSLAARLPGYHLFNVGFTNPLQVTAHRSSLDFVAVAGTGQYSIALVRTGSVWRYLDTGQYPGADWTLPTFADGGWKTGLAPLGYSNSGIATTVSYGGDSDNKHITTYFRRPFTVNNLDRLASIRIGLMRDDGAVVYLNGREAIRSNMPGGGISAATRAAQTVGGTEETAFFESDLDPSWLQEGANQLAVEVHQVVPDSTDLGFDLRLTAMELPAIPAPRIDWRIEDGELVLSWPALAIGWQLYSSPDFGRDESAWSVQPMPLAITNGIRFFRQPIGSGREFIQLRRP